MNWRDDSKLVWKKNCCLSSTFWNLFVYLFIFFFPLLIFSCTFLRISYGHRIQSEICIYPWPVCQKFWAWPSAAAAAVQFFLLSRAIWISFVFVIFPLYSFSNWRVDWWVATSVSFVVYPSNCCFFLFCFFLNQIKIKINKAGTQKRRNFQEMFWKISLTFSRVDFWQIML